MTPSSLTIARLAFRQQGAGLGDGTASVMRPFLGLAFSLGSTPFVYLLMNNRLPIHFTEHALITTSAPRRWLCICQRRQQRHRLFLPHAQRRQPVHGVCQYILSSSEIAIIALHIARCTHQME